MPTYYSPIVGAYYRPPAQLVLSSLPAGTELLLDPDDCGSFTNTPHDDPNAVAISVSRSTLRKSLTITPEFEEKLLNFGLTPNDLFNPQPQADGGYPAELHLGYLPRQPKDPSYISASQALNLIAPSPNWSATLAFAPTGTALVKLTTQPPTGSARTEPDSQP